MKNEVIIQFKKGVDPEDIAMRLNITLRYVQTILKDLR